MNDSAYIGLITGTADAGRHCVYLAIYVSRFDVSVFDMGAPCNDFKAMPHAMFEYGVFWAVDSHEAKKIKRNIHFLARSTPTKDLNSIKDIENETSQHLKNISGLLKRYDINAPINIFALVDPQEIIAFAQSHTNHEGFVKINHSTSVLNSPSLPLTLTDFQYVSGKNLFAAQSQKKGCKSYKLII